MRRRLERTDRSRREFIANASHELRTPLFALGGFLELLEDEEDPDARREFVATMHGQVSRLTRLATDLLDLSRLDAGGVEVAHDDVDLAERRRAGGAGLRRRRRAARRTVRCCRAAGGDRDRRRGARRPGGARAGRQRAPAQPAGRRGDADRWRRRRHRRRWSSRTTGRRSTPRRERLFDRFYRGPGGGEGSGLGLAIAHELAQRMGGALVARAARRRGRASPSG